VVIIGYFDRVERIHCRVLGYSDSQEAKCTAREIVAGTRSLSSKDMCIFVAILFPKDESIYCAHTTVLDLNSRNAAQEKGWDFALDYDTWLLISMVSFGWEIAAHSVAQTLNSLRALGKRLIFVSNNLGQSQHKST
jgi:hypothetical protein